MIQSRTASLAEATTHVVVGYVIAIALNVWIVGASVSQASRWSVWFVAASMVRGYVLRRLFARVSEVAS